LVIVGLLAGLAGAFVVAVLARGTVWSRKVLYTVPLVGPVARWTGLLNFSRLMALLLGQRIPLPKALRMAGAGLREADLSAACRGAARQVEGGHPLTESLSQFWQFPPSLRPLVSWAEGASDPAAAFRAGAEVFEGRVQMSIALLETILPPVAFVFILAAVGFLISGLMLPLISLIQSLS
jgi:type IV pilus assembly protein PilC